MTSSGITGSTLHVIYHAIVKALLFCCVGWIIKATGKRDINSIRGLGKKMPLLTFCTMLGALAISGVPSLALFNSEWLIFSSGFQTPYLSLAILEVLGSLLTVVYILRFVGRCFFSAAEGEETAIKPVPLSMKVATVSLSGLTIIAGFFPKPLFDIVVNELPFILGGGL
jgi:multicomponent Na+:H+ antiporter subunit D